MFLPCLHKSAVAHVPGGSRIRQKNLVNLFLTKLVRISGFSSLFSAIAVFLYPPTNVLKDTAIAEKREENPEILTNLVRKRLTRKTTFPRFEQQQLSCSDCGLAA